MSAIDPFGKELNLLLEDTYQSIGRLEDAMVRDLSQGSITIGELHTIERVARRRDAGITITQIAQEMGITLPSVTATVKKLERKGLVTKERSPSDARQVVIRLTDAGRKADVAHRYFHRKMVLSIAASIPDAEKPVLLEALHRINDFFVNRLQELEGGE